MNDLIDRKKVIQKLREHRRIFCPDNYHIYGFSILSKDEKARVDEIDNCIATIINLPSAEPERKKGRLKLGFFTCQCSECGALFRELEYTNFCSNCGADMRGEE